MAGEEIFGLIMMLGICFGFGIFCCILGASAERSKKPVAFWTGRELKPDQITDIDAYNRENSRMWKL